MIPRGADWLDSCCWRCGVADVPVLPGGDRRLCVPCIAELGSEPVVDAVALARHAYWESHALGCCWRCMTGAVDPDDELGMCRTCRDQLGASIAEGAA